MGKITVLAHRGSHADLPENTPAAFAAAVALGADGVELDVQKLTDGSYVVIHDAPVPGASPPALATVLAGLPRDRFLDIELKSETLLPADCPRILAEIVAAGVSAERLLITSFDPKLLPPWRAWGIATGLLLGDEAAAMGVRKLVRQLRSLRPSWLCVPVQAFSLLGNRRARLLLGLARLAGLRLAFWTIRTPDEIAQIRELADAIITDDVRMTLSVLAQAP